MNSMLNFVKSETLGVLKHKSGFVMKPKQEDDRGKRELEFYQTVFGHGYEKTCSPKVRSQLRNLIPEFLGLSCISSNLGEYFGISL